MTVPAGGVRALPRCRAPAPGQRAARRPRLRATTSRHTRNGRSAACSATTGPIAAPGQAAARSPAAASSSTQAGRPAERSIRPVTGPGRALSRTEPARWARDTDPASDPCPAAGAMTMPLRSPALTAPGLSRKPAAEPRSRSQYERHSIPATRPLGPRSPATSADLHTAFYAAAQRKISACGCSTNDQGSLAADLESQSPV